MEASRRDVATACSSDGFVALGTDWRLRTGLSAREDDGDSCSSLFAFSFSRSMALSLAALGAAGKNWAKLALEGRVIVSLSMAAAAAAAATNVDTFYHFHRPPTIISLGLNEDVDTIHERVDEIEGVGRGGQARRDTRQMRKGESPELRWEGAGTGADARARGWGMGRVMAMGMGWAAVASGKLLSVASPQRREQRSGVESVID